jgi:PadR family transcriptional regulator PadR
VKEISKAEEMVLLAVWRLGDRAYGVSIRSQILKDSGRDYTYGTLYGLLRQMDRKGYVHKAKAEPLPMKGGRGRSYFKITPSGIRALKEAIELHRRIWKNVDELALSGS